MIPGFWIRFTMRLFHMYGVIVLSSFVLYEGIFLKQEPQKSATRTFLLISSILTMITGGFVNFFLLKGFREKADPKEYRLWVIIVHLKLTISLLIFPPWLEWVMSKGTVQVIRVVFIFIFIVAAVYSKQIREFQMLPGNMKSSRGD